MGRLDGKIALVVGCARGIGAGVARVMAREGPKLVLADINVAGAEQVAAEIRAAGGDAVACAVDIAEQADVQAMTAFAVQQYGGLDVLANLAAAMHLLPADDVGDATTVDLAVWDQTMATNLRGYLLTMKYAIPEMLKRGGGSIINTSSACGITPQAFSGAYCTAKAGISTLTKHIAIAYGRRGIRCNAVAPGLIVTPENDLPERQGAFEMIRKHILVPRLGRPEDIGHVFVFLASDESAYVTGQVLQVDGGVLCAAPWSPDFGFGSGHGDR